MVASVRLYDGLAVRALKRLAVLDATARADDGERNFTLQKAVQGSIGAADDARVARITARLDADERARASALARQCRAVFALQSSVRRARDLLCRALARGRLFDLDDDRLQAALGHHHLALPPAKPKPYRSVAADLAVLTRMAPDRLGTRLVVVEHNALDLLDVDHSTTTTLSRSSVDEAVDCGTWIASFENSRLVAYRLDDLSRPRQIAELQDQAVIGSPETNTAWIADGDTAREVDDKGGDTGAVLVDRGYQLMVATSAYLVTGNGSDEPGIHIFDRRTRALVKDVPTGVVLGGKGGQVIWEEVSSAHVVSLQPSPLPNRPEVVALRADNARVAFAASTDEVEIADAAGHANTVHIAAAEDVYDLMWSRDGRWVFIEDGATVWYINASTMQANPLRLAHTDRQLVAAF